MQADMCGTCGGEHRTADCIKSNQGKFHCINYNHAGHVSWDCSCPRFIDECRRAERMGPKHTYRYFLMQEAWTWEQEGRDEGVRTEGWQEADLEPSAGLEQAHFLEVNSQQLASTSMNQEAVHQGAEGGPVRQLRLDEIPSGPHSGGPSHTPGNTN